MKAHQADSATESRHTTAAEGKYLTFALAEEEYGLGILRVKEIIGIMPVTHIPRTPLYVKGVINLRGKVIPVIDLRLRFGLPEIDYTEKTCIIVVEVKRGSTKTQMGIVVDSVSEVLNIKASDVEATPSFGTSLETNYILGMAKMDGGVKILLDIDPVLGEGEMEWLEGAAGGAPLQPEETITQPPAEAGDQIALD